MGCCPHAFPSAAAPRPCHPPSPTRRSQQVEDRAWPLLEPAMMLIGTAAHCQRRETYNTLIGSADLTNVQCLPAYEPLRAGVPVPVSGKREVRCSRGGATHCQPHPDCPLVDRQAANTEQRWRGTLLWKTYVE